MSGATATRATGCSWRRSSGSSAPARSQDAARVRLRALLRAQPRGTFLQHHQALSRHRNPLRKDCQKLPRRRPPRLRPGLAQMTTGPRPRARSAPLYRWIWLTLSFVSRRSSALPRWSRHYNSQIGRIRLWRTYSPKLGAGKFLELRHDGVLGNSPTHDCGRISSIKPEVIVGKGLAGVLEHVLGEHALDRLGAFASQVFVHPRVLAHVVESRLFSRVGGEHDVLVVPRPDVVVAAQSEVLAPLFRLSIIEDGREVCPIHLLELLDAEHGQDRGGHVVGSGVVVAPLARSLALGVAHHEDCV